MLNSALTELSNIVIDTIKQTEEYQRYISVLETIKQDSNLFERVNALRVRNFEIQQTAGDNALEMVDALTNEFADVINLEIVSDFFQAEVAYCHLIRDFSDRVTEGLDFN